MRTLVNVYIMNRHKRERTICTKFAAMNLCAERTGHLKERTSDSDIDAMMITQKY